MSPTDENTVQRHTSEAIKIASRKKKTTKANTHSDPVQNVDASDASHDTTPRSSSGRPILPSGFSSDHLASSSGWIYKLHIRRFRPIHHNAQVSASSGTVVVTIYHSPVGPDTRPSSWVTAHRQLSYSLRCGNHKSFPMTNVALGEGLRAHTCISTRSPTSASPQRPRPAPFLLCIISS